MEWYYVAALIAAFLGIVLLFWYLSKKGAIAVPEMKVITNIVTALTKIIETLANTNNNQVLDMADMVMEFVNQAVLAAENAWYNDEIAKEDRKEYCMARLRECLEAYHIELTEVQWSVVDVMIKAFCEQMGHTLKEAVDITE